LGNRCGGISKVRPSNRAIRGHRAIRFALSAVFASSSPKTGIGAEAVQAVLAYCLKELSVHRVEALIHPDNTGSIRIA
jgi:ribosomal-protein-alanine N-acetyltransferase